MRRILGFIALALVVPLLVPAPAGAASAPDRGRAFVPKAKSRSLYATQDPSVDPELQRHYVEGHDGVDLYVETWLPAPKDGRKPPKKIPTILIMTPYVVQGQEEYPAGGGSPSFISYFTERGFAVAQHHVRGTGESGGCLEQTAANQVDDGARVVEYLGRDAPWSNGKVGMFGISYDAETQISTAGFGPAKRLRYLEAIVPLASVGSQYDWNFMDGVNWVGQPLIGNTFYLAGVSAFPGQTVAPQHYPEKLECQADVMGNSANATGDYTAYWRAREYRPGAPKVKAATFYVHGLRDFNVQPITAAGWFDRLSDKTPHKGMFGVWYHAFPDRHGSLEPTWERADWWDSVTAWFDRYLKGLDTGVERWPAVQIQDNLGRWWAAPEYPTTGGPAGHLALGPEGTLGARRPQGSTSYIEQTHIGSAAPGQNAVFETAPLEARLHLTGQPILDLWVEVDRPDAHVAAALEVIGPDGEVMTHVGAASEAMATYGVRSLQHLEPMRRGWFEQAEGIAPSTSEPIHVNVRFLPTDLTVPKGSSLRVTISGSVAYSKGESQPSGTATAVTILHDCRHPSFLRFLMPDPRAQLLNVREEDEKGKLRSKRTRIGREDGGGLARAEVCGKSPVKVRLLRDGTER